jgi:hypothetical protein
MAGWKTTVLGYIGKTLTAAFAAATAAIGGAITALVQIGEGASFSEIETVAWLTILATGLAAFGGVLGITAKQSG